MKKALPSLMVFVFLSCLAVVQWQALRAQNLYSTQFKGKDGIVYNGLLVYFNEENAYMRIGYNVQGVYQVVNVEYTGMQFETEGGSAFVLYGENPSFITTQKSEGYNPDHFVWVWDEEYATGIPLVTDDPEGREENFVEATYFRELTKADVTETLLKSYYRSDEKDYLTFRRAFGLDKTGNPGPGNSGSNITLHLMLVTNTAISDIGRSCKLDQQSLVQEFQDVASVLGIGFKKTVIEGNAFHRSNVEQSLANLNPGSNDVVVFVYRGHGFRWDDQKSYWPVMDLRTNAFASDLENTSVSIDYVYNELNKKPARLKVILADCCNSNIGSVAMTPTHFLTAQSFYAGADLTKLRKLFIESKGVVLSSAASPGEYSWANNAYGGFYTRSFIQALHENVSYLTSYNPGWDGLINQTIHLAKAKTDKCRECTPQNGIRYLSVQTQ